MKILNYYKNILKKHSREYLNLFTNKPIVVVYTMGKVGSSSLYLSLKKYLNSSVYFTHRMLKENIENYATHFVVNNTKPPFQKLGAHIYKYKIAKKTPIKIITTVREPIGRNVSAFFQNINMYVPQNKLNLNNIEELTDLFLNKNLNDIPTNWWSEEFEKVTKIKIADLHFDKQKKYQIIKNQNFEILLFRIDLDKKSIEQILSSFLNIDNFELQNYNETATKKHSEVYDCFKKMVVLPKPYIEKLLSHPNVSKFFTAEELKETRKKWRRIN